MPRRYKIGLNGGYDTAFDHFKEQSALLNPHGQVVNNLLVEANNDPAAVMHEWESTKIPKAQASLDAAILEFEKLQNKARRTGRPVPETEPPAIREQRLRCEAKVDITADEVTALKRLAEQKKKAEAAKKTADCLPHGPRGVGIGEPVRMVDNQPVTERGGELFISCKSSPYDGLALPTYHQQIVLPYLRASRAARKEGKGTPSWPKRPEA